MKNLEEPNLFDHLNIILINYKFVEFCADLTCIINDKKIIQTSQEYLEKIINFLQERKFI